MDTPNAERMLEGLGRRRMSALSVQPRSNSFYDPTLLAMARGAADTAVGPDGVPTREEAHKEMLASWLTLVRMLGSRLLDICSLTGVRLQDDSPVAAMTRGAEGAATSHFMRCVASGAFYIDVAVNKPVYDVDEGLNGTWLRVALREAGGDVWWCWLWWGW